MQNLSIHLNKFRKFLGNKMIDSLDKDGVYRMSQLNDGETFKEDYQKIKNSSFMTHETIMSAYKNLIISPWSKKTDLLLMVMQDLKPESIQEAFGHSIAAGQTEVMQEFLNNSKFKNHINFKDCDLLHFCIKSDKIKELQVLLELPEIKNLLNEPVNQYLCLGYAIFIRKAEVAKLFFNSNLINFKSACENELQKIKKDSSPQKTHMSPISLEDVAEVYLGVKNMKNPATQAINKYISILESKNNLESILSSKPKSSKVMKV